MDEDAASSLSELDEDLRFPNVAFLSDAAAEALCEYEEGLAFNLGSLPESAVANTPRSLGPKTAYDPAFLLSSRQIDCVYSTRQFILNQRARANGGVIRKRCETAK